MRTVSVVLSALILGIVLVLPVNRILTFTPASTEYLIVLEKNPGNLVIELYMIIITSMSNGKGNRTAYK